MNANKVIRERFRVKRGDALPFTGWLGSTRKDIYQLFKEFGYTKGAEVGVYDGMNARDMLKIIPSLNLTLVDPWEQFGRRHKAEEMQIRYERTQNRLKRWFPIFIRKTSVEGAKDINNESLDFVYIDGMHDFDNVIIDLIAWSKKVRRGGVISGHDFWYGYSATQGVIGAVTAYTQAHNIRDWYITGGPGAIKTDVPPSYFWVKE